MSEYETALMCKPIDTKLHKLVSEAIKNSLENGYEFNDYTLDELACDMVAYDSDIEHYEAEDVLKVLIEKLIGKDSKR